MPNDPSVTEFTYQYDPARALIQPRDYQLKLIRALYERTRTATPGARLLIEVATGGGKNLIANDFVWDRAGEGKRVLRVTLNWLLAAQAAADLCNRRSGARDKISYVGSGAGSRAMNGLRKTASGQIVFTTIQTWHARKDTDFAGQASLRRSLRSLRR
jgi:superfamily II DNA or RNA helicase